MKRCLIAIALILISASSTLAQDNDPDMGGHEGVPPSAGSGSRVVKPPVRGSGRSDSQVKAWCRWGQDPKQDKCSDLGSGIGD